MAKWVFVLSKRTVNSLGFCQVRRIFYPPDPWKNDPIWQAYYLFQLGGAKKTATNIVNIRNKQQEIITLDNLFMGKATIETQVSYTVGPNQF